MNLISNLFRTKSKTCVTCGTEARDVLTAHNKAGFYCREHLISTFKRYFLDFSHPVVIYAPQFNEPHLENTYAFYPLDEMASYDFSEEEICHVERLLQETRGKRCRICRSSAETLFFERISYTSSGPNVVVLAYPEGTALCREHGYERLEPLIRANPNHFEDFGLVAPYKGQGIFVGTFL